MVESDEGQDVASHRGQRLVVSYSAEMKGPTLINKTISYHVASEANSVFKKAAPDIIARAQSAKTEVIG
jgi:hypothetical protein